MANPNSDPHFFRQPPVPQVYGEDVALDLEDPNYIHYTRKQTLLKIRDVEKKLFSPEQTKLVLDSYDSVPEECEPLPDNMQMKEVGYAALFLVKDPKFYRKWDAKTPKHLAKDHMAMERAKSMKGRKSMMARKSVAGGALLPPGMATGAGAGGHPHGGGNQLHIPPLNLGGGAGSRADERSPRGRDTLQVPGGGSTRGSRSPGGGSSQQQAGGGDGTPRGGEKSPGGGSQLGGSTLNTPRGSARGSTKTSPRGETNKFSFGFPKEIPKNCIELTIPPLEKQRMLGPPHPSALCQMAMMGRR